MFYVPSRYFEKEWGTMRKEPLCPSDKVSALVQAWRTSGAVSDITSGGVKASITCCWVWTEVWTCVCPTSWQVVGGEFLLTTEGWADSNLVGLTVRTRKTPNLILGFVLDLRANLGAHILSVHLLDLRWTWRAPLDCTSNKVVQEYKSKVVFPE